MKFSVTWLEEKTTQIDVADIGEAEMYSVAMINRLGGFPATKLLSIYEVKITPQQGDGKPPTPFGRPPSGTLGGGQMKIAEALPDAIAVAA
jgi:hypothetical protein